MHNSEAQRSAQAIATWYLITQMSVCALRRMKLNRRTWGTERYKNSSSEVVARIRKWYSAVAREMYHDEKGSLIIHLRIYFIEMDTFWWFTVCDKTEKELAIIHWNWNTLMLTFLWSPFLIPGHSVTFVWIFVNTYLAMANCETASVWFEFD